MTAKPPLSPFVGIHHQGLQLKLRVLRQLSQVTQQELLLSNPAELPRLAAEKENTFQHLRAIDRRLTLRPPSRDQQQRAQPLIKRFIQAIVANNVRIEQKILAERRSLLKEMKNLDAHHKLQAHLQREAGQKQPSKGAFLRIKH